MTVIPRRPIRAAVWAATAALTMLGSTVFAQADRANLVPANAAYVANVPKSKELWSAWKQNSIYLSFRRLMEEPEFKSKTEGFGREVATIEEALGFKLDGETMSQIFSDATVYVAPGENAGQASIGFALGVADKDRLQKLIDLAEKAAVSAAQNNESEDASATESKSSGETEEKATPASGKKSKSGKSSRSGSSDGSGGADKDDATSAPSPITTEEHAGVSFKRFASGEESEFFYAVAGDVFLGTTSRSEMTALIDRSKGGQAGAGSLAADANYKKVIGALSSNPGEIYFYNNAKSAAELQQSQPGMDKFRELFRKIAPVDYTATSINVEPRQITSYSYGPLVEGQGSELLKKNTGQSALTVANYATSNALLVFATSLLDSNLLYELLQQAVGASGTDSEAFDKQMQGLESTLGFSVKNDLVPALGNEFGLLINSFKFSGTTPAVEGVVAFRIADRAKLDKVTAGIDKLAAQMAGGASSGDDASKKSSGAAGLTSTKVGNATVKTMEIPGQTAYSPGYAVDGDYFLIGSSLSALRNSITARQDPTKSLASSATFKALAPKVSINANGLQYFNFSGIWETVRMLTAFAGENAETAAKVVDALKVLHVLGASSSVQDGAIVSNGVLLLNEPGAPAAGGETTQSGSAATTTGEAQ